MAAEGVVGLFGGAVILGAVHGIEPGHGWPVAASYALDRGNKWLYGFAASLILGVGHLISSIAMVAVFFYAKSYFELTQLNEPVVFANDIQIGGPVSLFAGVLLIVLGIREYRHGHSHSHDGHDHGSDGHGHAHDDHTHDSHSHDDHTHDTDSHHDQGSDFQYAVGDGHGEHPHNDGQGHSHSDDGGRSYGHDHGLQGADADRGLLGIAWFAFVLGFAHEEEFEIIALCAGSNYCLELMLAYALTVIVGIVGLTLLLIAGYQEFESEVEKYTPYLPVFSAVVLVVMGLGFITGLF